jgi:PAS domain S-box-containing protein
MGEGSGRAVRWPQGLGAEGLAEALDAAGFGFAVTIDDGTRSEIRYVSARAAEIMGVPADEIVGSSGFLRIAPEEQERMAERRRRRAAGDPMGNRFETVIVRADGRRVPLEVGLSFVDLDGHKAYVSFIRDIGERKRADAALAASEARFRSLIDNAPDAVFVSQGQRLHFVNPAMARMLGYERPDELTGASLVDLMHPDDVATVARRIVEIEAERGPQPAADRRLLHKQGHWVPVEVTTMGIEFDGRPSIIGYARDLTARRALQAQLLQADRMAAVGALAAGVAHEINNPLAYVMLNLDLVMRQLRHAGGGEDIIEKLAEAREGAERVALIVRDLLSFARSEESWGPVNLRDCVEGAIKMIKNELRGRARLTVEWGDLPPIDGNSARLGQVFLNLLINALQALPPARGPERNHIRVVAFERGDDAVIEVHDNGPGIPEAALPRLFEPFFTTKPAGEGTGLGLSIGHSIVTSMGGTLVARNLPAGAGAVFAVALPRRGKALRR